MAYGTNGTKPNPEPSQAKPHLREKDPEAEAIHRHPDLPNPLIKE